MESKSAGGPEHVKINLVMKISYQWVLWSILALSAIMAVILLMVISDMSLFKTTPFLYAASVTAASAGLALLMQNRYYLPFLKNMRLQGRLLVSPLLLLALSAPAAMLYIYHDLNGRETLKLLSALFSSLAAIFFFASFFTYTLPSLTTVFNLYSEEGALYCRIKNIRIKTVAAIILLALIFILLRVFKGYSYSGLVLLLPLLALFQIILDIVLSVEFRNTIVATISRGEGAKTQSLNISDEESVAVSGFRSILLFPSHYLDLVSGRLDYLINRADDSYASEVVHVAGRTFDPALVPALKVINSGAAFSKGVKQEASGVINNIEKYFSDPVRNSDLLRLPGIQEKTAVTRSILTGKKVPQASELLRLLGDPNPDIRRIGLAAAGRFGMKELREEAMQALQTAETEREAFYLLNYFGPDTYGEIIGSYFKTQNRESVSLMMMRLLSMMPLNMVTPLLTDFISGGPVTVRLKAVKYLCEQGFVTETKHRHRIEEAIIETVFNIGRLIALQLEAKRNRYFILSDALEWERNTNNELLFSLLSLLVGNATGEAIRSKAAGGSAYDARVTAEVIDVSVTGPVRKPLQALLGNHPDSARLAELSYLFPLREVMKGSLATAILSTDQNITGVWTKACALHKIASERHGVGKEIVMSYLFSNSLLLQEEAANVIAAVDPGWFNEVEARLTDQVRNRVARVVSKTVPEVAMTFGKTRFLSLCFNKIPEERMLILASGMRYSESYDSGSLPGVITWIVPSDQGKSGLYSLPVSDITNFVFHFSEYTDIFVNYIDNRSIDTV